MMMLPRHHCWLWQSIAAVAALSWSTLAATPPADFQVNSRVGPGGTKYKDSPHFRIYNAPSDSAADSVIKSLEAAYSCFVDDLGWRSSGLSFKQEDDNGPWYKVNVYTVSTLPGAAANTGTDQTAGLSFLNVVTQYLTEPSVTVHEFGHALTYAERYWIDQIRTGAWWEPLANFVADTYLTSPLCAQGRSRFGQAEGSTLIDLRKVLGDSHQVIVDGTRDSGNYYQAWPFLTYMHNNPDNYTGLGLPMFPAVWTRYQRNSNETPLHVLNRLVSPALRIQAVVGRYWARMAYVDIGHVQAARQFAAQRSSIKYANLDSQGGGRYRVKAARQPRYMGANIIPLRTTGAGATIGVTVTASAGMPFTATLAVRSTNGAVRYIDLPRGTGNATLGNGEEASLVVVNTPDTLYLYDPFSLTSEVSRGLDYQLQLTGATA